MRTRQSNRTEFCPVCSLELTNRAAACAHYRAHAAQGELDGQSAVSVGLTAWRIPGLTARPTPNAGWFDHGFSHNGLRTPAGLEASRQKFLSRLKNGNDGQAQGWTEEALREQAAGTGRFGRPPARPIYVTATARGSLGGGQWRKPERVRLSQSAFGTGLFFDMALLGMWEKRRAAEPVDVDGQTWALFECPGNCGTGGQPAKDHDRHRVLVLAADLARLEAKIAAPPRPPAPKLALLKAVRAALAEFPAARLHNMGYQRDRQSYREAGFEIAAVTGERAARVRYDDAGTIAYQMHRPGTIAQRNLHTRHLARLAEYGAALEAAGLVVELHDPAPTDPKKRPYLLVTPAGPADADKD